ncbi:hypothetical protein ABBQ32_006030 [Trebouxia sp. C0010 RCD-2024]
MQTPSTVGTPFPFAAALAGKHVKVDLPKPSKFSRIAVDSDIRAWLLRMHEYLTISGIEQNVWVVFASNYLDKAPRQLWEARKTQLAEQPEVLYSWDNFREWCLSSFRGTSTSGHEHVCGAGAIPSAGKKRDLESGSDSEPVVAGDTDALAIVPLTPDDDHGGSVRRSSREHKKPKPYFELASTSLSVPKAKQGLKSGFVK